MRVNVFSVEYRLRPIDKKTKEVRTDVPGTIHHELVGAEESGSVVSAIEVPASMALTVEHIGNVAKNVLIADPKTVKEKGKPKAADEGTDGGENQEKQTVVQ